MAGKFVVRALARFHPGPSAETFSQESERGGGHDFCWKSFNRDYRRQFPPLGEGCRCGNHFVTAQIVRGEVGWLESVMPPGGSREIVL